MRNGLTAAALLVLATTGLSQSPPATPSRSIAGIVVAAESGMTGKSRVDLVRISGEPVQTFFTDASGRFEFEVAAAGRYNVVAARTGYATAAYGARRAGESGTVLDLSSVNRLDHLRIELPRSAAISGRIVDDLGEPLIQHRVFAHKAVWIDGRPRLVETPPVAVTDERGEYRIGGLTAGSYAVLVSRVPILVAAAKSARPGPATYFPGTASRTAAQLMTVTPGQELINVDWVAAPSNAPLPGVFGTVVDTSGEPVTGTVSAVSVDGNVSVTAAIGGGEFSLAFEPGAYVLAFENRHDRSEAAAIPFWVDGRQRVTLPVRLRPGSRVSGRVVSDDGVRPDFRGIEIRAVIRGGDTGPALAGQRSVYVSESGAFELVGLAGVRQLIVDGVPSGWALQSIMHNGTDLSDREVAFDEPVRLNVQVVLTRRFATVTGRGRGGSTDVVQYTVVVLPEDLSRLADFRRWARLIRSDHTGSYEVTNLLPGPYVMVALADLEESTWSNPDFVRRLHTSGVRVNVGPGERASIDLDVLPR
jgi:hypothetical protein